MNQLTINQLTPDELHALAVTIAGTRSRIDAPHWEPHEIVAVLRSVSHELAETMRTAGINAANDKHADRPVTITFTRYRPKIDEQPADDWKTPKCSTCGRSEKMCQFVGRKHLDAQVPDAWHPFIPLDLNEVRARYGS